MGPVTTNPWLIAAINMTIVFGVLAMLGFLMKVIYFVDPTRQKKTANPVAASAPAAARGAAPAGHNAEPPPIPPVRCRPDLRARRSRGGPAAPAARRSAGLKSST